MGLLRTSCRALLHTIPRIWEKWIRTVRKKWENMNISKLRVSGVANTWENWISIIREKYRKTQTFQIYGFLKNFGWSRNPYNSQNLGKVNSHNTYKYGEKKQTFQSFSNVLGQAEIHTIPKIWEKWIPIVRKKYEKTQTFQSVSEIFHLMQKSMQFAKHGKSGFPLCGKGMEKHKHFKFMGFLNISDEAEIHTIPRTWE